MRRISLAGVLFALGACAHAPIQPSDTHLRAEGPAPSGTVPAPIQISTILPKPKPTQRPETYSVVVNGVRAQELLFALARDAKLNIDVHPGITGAVTLNAIERRAGIGTLLMTEYCARIDRAHMAGYLETDKPVNVTFYERFGFQTIGSTPVLNTPNWFMKRDER